MIQRIQSVWLFLASVTIFALFLFPYLQYADPSGLGLALKVTGKYGASEGQAVRQELFLLQTIATIVLGIFPLYIIFRFGQRKAQVKLGLLAIVLVVLFGVWLYFAASAALAVAGQQLSATNIGVGFFLLPIAIVFLLMAIGAIRKDEKLVRSADRLR